MDGYVYLPPLSLAPRILDVGLAVHERNPIGALTASSLSARPVTLRVFNLPLCLSRLPQLLS